MARSQLVIELAALEVFEAFESAFVELESAFG